MQNTSWEMLGWMMHKLESRLPGEISITSDMQIIPLLWQKVKKNSRASWRKWKGWLKAQHSENEDHGVWSHHFMANRLGNSGNSGWLYFGGAPKSLQIVIAAMKLKDTCSLEEKLWPRQHIKKSEILLCQQRSILSRLWFFQWSCMDVTVGL